MNLALIDDSNNSRRQLHI